MSQIRTQFDATLEIKVGTVKVMSLTIEDPETGGVVDLSDTDTYDDGNFRIREPDKTLIADIQFIYLDRPGGVIEFTVNTTVTTIENAGNWEGIVQFININDIIIDQRTINFNILA